MIEGNLIGKYGYGALAYERFFGIDILEPLTEEEINNLKYINSNNKINLIGEACFQTHVISKKLKELNKNTKIIMYVKDKEKINKYIFSHNIEYENIYVGWNYSREIPLKLYIKLEKFLYQSVEPAKHLSPLEKYIYAYNITKQFKQYKENELDWEASRFLYAILINEYMVCVGFATLLGDLLDKLGIVSIDIDVKLDTSYDGIKNFKDFKEEEKVVRFGNHMRRYVYLVDEKYGINGFYISDPTFDNNLKEDYYNHMLMTNNEASSSRRYLHFENYSFELLNVSSVEEFYEKISLFKKKERIGVIIVFLMDIIKSLDFGFINILEEKYNIEVDKYCIDNNLIEKNLEGLLFDLSNYVVNHVNKTISGDTIMKAVEVIYKLSYGYKEEKLPKKLYEVLQKNKERHDVYFPTRYKLYSDGSKVIYDNEINKFDIDYVNKTK